MGELTKSMSAPERIRQLQRAQLASGELVLDRKLAIYSPYISDPNFLQSPAREEITELGLVNMVVSAAKAAMGDLRIRKPVTIRSSIPSDVRGSYIIPSLGIGGVAMPSSYVELFFDPRHPRVVESLAMFRERQVGHELNHIARMQAGRMGNTLLDAIICEGLATYYEEHWQNQYKETPWGHELSEEQVREEWGKVQLQLGSTDFDYDAWFFGKNQDHPLWTGYALGRAIIETYMRKHPREKMRRLVRRDSRAILQGLKGTEFNP